MNLKTATVIGASVVTSLLVGVASIMSPDDSTQKTSQSQTSKSATASSTTSQSSSASSQQPSDVATDVDIKDMKPTGGGSFYVNNNAATVNANIKSAPWVNFSKVDNLGRPGQANAWLNKSLRQYANRNETGNSQTINPVGWHQTKIGNTWVYNRGHLLGYAIIGGMRGVDASEANRQNIITQTAWANQSSALNSGQNYYEGIVRKALDSGKLVRYQVTPKYVGSELVARGTQLQAKSSDGSVDFNVYVPNVQPGVKIDYKTGYVEK